jgi:hypothetical protein
MHLERDQIDLTTATVTVLLEVCTSFVPSVEDAGVCECCGWLEVEHVEVDVRPAARAA